MSWYISEDETIQRDSLEIKKVRFQAHFIYFLIHLKLLSWKIKRIGSKGSISTESRWVGQSPCDIL